MMSTDYLKNLWNLGYQGNLAGKKFFQITKVERKVSKSRQSTQKDDLKKTKEEVQEKISGVEKKSK